MLVIKNTRGTIHMDWSFQPINKPSQIHGNTPYIRDLMTVIMSSFHHVTA